MSSESSIDILTSFGLSRLDAKVFIALLNLGTVDAGQIAKAVNVARQQVYRALTNLISLGLVMRVVATPTQFHAIPLSEGMASLLLQTKAKTKELERKAELLIKKHPHKAKSIPSKYWFVEVPSNSSHNQSLKQHPITKQFDSITSLKRFGTWLFHVEKMFKEVLDNGVKTRFIIEKPAAPSSINKIIEDLNLFSSCEVRYAKTAGPNNLLQFTIIDGQVGFPTEPLSSYITPLFITNHPSLVTLAQEYFEIIWRDAERTKFKPVGNDSIRA
ncbi:MAG: TrmB family transcriptional regulator [Candidatus Bathyarchaeia archaeon]|jgi:sugar-specific transcriptional regulator TrmB